jgi:hypothetical protein
MRTMHLFLAGAAVLGFRPAPATAAEDYLQWGRYRDITLDTSPGGADVATDQIGFPVLVTLASLQADVFSQARPGGADVRFSTAEGRHLPYQIEQWDAAARKAAIWVRVDTVKGGDAAQRLRLYWGNSGAADSSDGKAVFRTGDGFRGVWHLGNAEDASANGSHGKDSGTSAAEGRIGGARRFDNPDAYAKSGKYIAFGNPAGLDVAGRITLEAWVKWERRDGHRIILCHGSAPGSDFETVLRIGEAKDYRAGVWTGAGHYAMATVPAADSNTWVHLAGVFTGSGWTLYRNGAKFAESGADTNGAKPSPGAWRIGAEFASNAVTRYFHGTLDEVRLSNTARSADWIRLCHANQRDGQAFVTLGAAMTTSLNAHALSDMKRRRIGAALRGRRLFPSRPSAADWVDASGAHRPVPDLHP